MKNIYTYIVLLSISILFACKKNNVTNTGPTITEGKKYPITINLADFSQVSTGSVSKLSTNALVSDPAIIRSSFDVIGYAVYTGSERKFLHAKLFDAKTYTSGIIKDSLLAGNYTIVIYAGQNGIILNDQLLSYGSTTIGQVKYGNPWKDTFVTNFVINVPNSYVDLTVPLYRIVSQVEVNFKDIMPADAYSISITPNINYVNYNAALISTSVDSNFPLNPNATTIIPDSSKNKPNFKFRYITLFRGFEFTFILDCKRRDGTSIMRRQFDPGVMKWNLTKVFTGDFFNGPQSNMQVSINPIWVTDPANNRTF